MVYFEELIYIIGKKTEHVSILVLMDGVLRADTLYIPIRTPCVSILVLMDGVLREIAQETKMRGLVGFNPCSNGWCTSRLM